MEAGGFKELVVWREGMAIAKQVYAITAKFPAAERFGLVQQLRRSAVSIPSNIAEGHARGTPREFSRFVSIALGSVAELETQLLLSFELGLTPLAQDVLDNCRVLGKRLQKLRQYWANEAAKHSENT